MLLGSLESPLDCKEIQPVHPKGNQSWIFTGKIDAEAEAPILWPPDETRQDTGKDPDAGKDWRQEEKGVTEGETVDGIIVSMGKSLSNLQKTVKDREAKPVMLQSTGLQRVGHDWATEQQN